jgi:maltooligosyltrehalose trehalohydrolase
MMTHKAPGAVYLGQERTEFTVWAPFRQSVEVHITSPGEQILPLDKDDRGYFRKVVKGVLPGSRYFYRLERQSEYPDPASRFQPEGVHSPSEVLSPVFTREDNRWPGLPLKEYIIYELHVGTFTSEGTFDALTRHLEGLKNVGITAIELMPVAQFPGARNWGYDGVYPYAVQNSYGGPDGLERLVNACHQHGMAVILDVVYNHLGPEGNHLGEFGPYFTDRYHTPWGAALNFDGAYSDEVRRFFIENALYWVTEFRIDALRLDALHAILDTSAYTFIEELAVSVRQRAAELGRKIYLIGESAANDARLVRSKEKGGYGLDAQWNDDFHHALHTLLTAENTGYYEDFGKLSQLEKAYSEGFVYSGEYSSYRRRRHGSSSRDIPAERFVVFSQNHDQVGNRARGDRLGQVVSFEALKVAAGLVLLSPFIPMLFMGEEYGETAPFPFFVSHTDPQLVEAVRKGRRQEFSAFDWQAEVPDPQDEATFLSARLNHSLRGEGHHKIIYQFYSELIRLRREIPALSFLGKENLEVRSYENSPVLVVRRWHKGSETVIIYHLNERAACVTLSIPPGRWKKALDSSEESWKGGGSSVAAVLESGGEVTLNLPPQSVVIIQRES